MLALLNNIPDRKMIRNYADVGCGHGDVISHMDMFLKKAGFPIERTCGYDISPFPKDLQAKHPGINFIQRDFLSTTECFDLITLNDVLEHISSPQKFLERIADRTHYLALHIPLDARLSVLLADQFNFRLSKVGHISFWTPFSALNLLSASGFLPLGCRFTPGFLAPSGRERLLQWLALPARCAFWFLSPGLTATALGGVSLAVLARGRHVGAHHPAK